MSSLDTIEKILNTKLINHQLKYCLVSKDKLPIKIDGNLAKPNDVNDFVDLENLLLCNDLNDYAGVGISIQGSKICAIDVDHCFKKANDINSIDERGKDILNLFQDKTYCEFSFSGTGLRILFTADMIDNYSLSYYTKNKNTNVEFYQPGKSYRYVTITGNFISNFDINYIDSELLIEFLQKYMIKRAKTRKFQTKEIPDDKSIDKLFNRVKLMYFKNNLFQELWFAKAPGSGKNESELDYQLISILFENITQNRDKLKALFEMSPYFKSKDYKHMNKWKNYNYRYFNYLYDIISHQNN